MHLLASVFSFALKKVGLFGALVLGLFLAYLVMQALVPALREAVAERDRLQQASAERAAVEAELGELRRRAEQGRGTAAASIERRVQDAIEQGRRDIDAKKADVERLRDSEQELCSIGQKIVAWVAPGDACKSAQRALAKGNEVLDTLEMNLARARETNAVLSDPDLTTQQKLDRLNEGGEQSLVERELAAKEAELDQKQAEERSLEQTQASGLGWVVNQAAESWRWLAAIALVVLFLPLVLRVVSYFLLMPLVSRVHRPIELAEGSGNVATDIHTTPAGRTLTIDLGDGEILTARSEHVRPVQGKKISGRLLYDWTSPFISFAAGLRELSRVTGDGGATAVTLSTPDDPDSYLKRVDFIDHPGLVVRPQHVVGVIGHPALKTRWRWGVAALARWQVRYIMFAGTGSLIIQGSGDVKETSPDGGSLRMEQHLLIGFDTHLTVGVRRTEVFWPYLRGRTPLVDDEFSGRHTFFWQKANSDGPTNPIARVFNGVFSAFGKLLGF